MKEGNGEAVSFFHFSLIHAVGCAEGTLVRQKEQKLPFFLCFVLTYPYLWLRRRYSRSTKKAKTSVFFVLCSLIRTFALAIGSPPHQNWMVWRRS